MSQEILDKAVKIVNNNSACDNETGFGFCTLSLLDSEGFPTTSIITPAKSNGLNWITFGTMLDQNRVSRITNCNRASVCFGTPEYCINLVGEIEIITDEAVKHEMWYEGLSHHFTGPSDPNYCVLKFNTKRYKLFLDYQEIEGKL